MPSFSKGKPRMTNYVLIHGGHSGGEAWEKAAGLLRRQGHAVYHPTLTAHIAEVCALIEENRLARLILAGHSYAGFVITGAADRMPDRIEHLVYLDAMVPVSGLSLFGMFEMYGVPYQTYGLKPDRPFVEPLFFDEEKIRGMNKTYVHCTESRFLEISGRAYDRVLENAVRDHWVCCELDTDHLCMSTMPEETAEILLDAGTRTRMPETPEGGSAGRT